MDARATSRSIPLVVDLDGTLIKTDMLHECLALAMRANPFVLFLAIYWLVKGGKVLLKAELAKRTPPDPAQLPYRQDLINWLREEKAAGRKIVLATASHRSQAEAIADHLGLFDAVHATDGAVNLSGSRKRDALNAEYGDGGYDYAGNSRDDLALFDAAHAAIVVAPDRSARAWHKAHGGLLFDDGRAGMKTFLKMLRWHQWLKNVLIAVPLVLAHEIGNPAMIGKAALAFVAFSLAASAIYIVNDVFDLASDRKHATKRKRPLASGAISIRAGILTAVGLAATAMAVSLLLPVEFALVLFGYFVATTAYSLVLKRMLLIDVIALASLYIVRIVAGSAALSLDASFWLLAFAGFFFLSLALVKRYVELTNSNAEEGQKIAGRGYRPEDRDVIMQSGLGSAFAAVLVLALYVDSSAVRELYAVPWMIWPLAPIVLYVNLRLWILARRGEMDEDPVVFIITDWRSQIVVAIGGLMLLAAALAG